MRYALMVMFFLTSGCSIRTFAPTAGALVGGGIGSLAGPIGGGLGAAGGAALGQVVKGEGDVIEAKAELKALTQGDVGKLIAMQASKDKSGFDSVIDGIYRVLWLLGVGMILWFIIPWVWARSHVKKTVEKHINGNKT
jgi:hypothetical protein